MLTLEEDGQAIKLMWAGQSHMISKASTVRSLPRNPVRQRQNYFPASGSMRAMFDLQWVSHPDFLSSAKISVEKWIQLHTMYQVLTLFPLQKCQQQRQPHSCLFYSLSFSRWFTLHIIHWKHSSKNRNEIIAAITRRGGIPSLFNKPQAVGTL